MNLGFLSRTTLSYGITAVLGVLEYNLSFKGTFTPSESDVTTLLQIVVVWLEKRGFFVGVLITVQTHCSFSQKIAPVLNIFCM